MERTGRLFRNEMPAFFDKHLAQVLRSIPQGAAEPARDALASRHGQHGHCELPPGERGREGGIPRQGAMK
ncbi:hypothetical protein ASF53_21055 [Methylobacterium sp. Leaf123]|nr:hypothetical protein ASF53_21055 [Methylobacterium sp. Leaf123]